MNERELTLAGLLADPMTRALMAADHVDIGQLTAEWTALAGRLAIARATERRPEPAHNQCAHLPRGRTTW